MRQKAKAWIAVALRAALLCCCWIGVRDGVLPPGGGFMASEKLLYYTYQSNLWVMAVTAVCLALGIAALVRGRQRIPRALQIARYAVAVGITLTFLVFWVLLAPLFRTADLLTLNNQMLHTVVPLLFVADFLLLDRGTPVGRFGALWAVGMPAAYLVFSFAYAAAYPGHVFKGSGRYAYFFLDVDKYGWLGTEAGMGVLWWLLILAGVTLLLGYGYRLLQQKGPRKKPLQERMEQP